MQTTDIFIARHGQTDYNRHARIQGRGINKPLNETGRRQARCMERWLKSENLNHIFSSSLRRSVETAQLIGDELNLEVKSYPELDEMDFGVIEGQPISEIKEELQQLHTAWRGGDTAFALDNAESPEVVLERVLGRLDMLLETHRGQSILLVLHGRLIRIILAHWLHEKLTEMHRIEHQNGALYHLRMNGEQKVEPIFLNKTEHLEIGG